MSHLIIIPPRSFSAAAAANRAPTPTAASALGSASGFSPLLPTTLKGLLANRRGDLIAFANIALASAAGLGHSLSTAASAPQGRRIRAGVRGAKKLAARAVAARRASDSPVKVLAALGALIVDEAAVDREALEGSLGATVIENFLIPLEYPVETGATSAALGGGNDGLWHLEDINVAAARAKGFRGEGIIAGVLDTGIDAEHPEFAGKKVHFAEFDAVGNKLSSVARDAGNHGTHVSGLIAGKNVGVAPKAELAVAAVLTIPGPRGLSGYFAQILAGMDWLLTTPFATGANAEPGVDVMNASLGGIGYSDFYYQTLANARLTTGTVLAAAIGNAGPARNNHGSPGNYDIAVGVGATDAQNEIANFSDWGTVSEHHGITKPDLCAPGKDVVSSVPGGGYSAMSGTSMATPVVAGALALLLQQDSSLLLNASGLIARLYGLLSPLSGAANIRRGGRGRLDLTGI